MSFFGDVKQAWASSDQNRLAGLMRLDYSDENTWKAKAVEFLAVSEEAQIKTVELFRLAKHVQEQLIGNRKLTWLLHIVPHLLNSYNGQDFDDYKWAAAAAGGSLPEPASAWQDVQGWVQDWTERLIKQAGNFRDNLGLFQQTARASKHRPAVFHPFVLRVLHQHGIPAGAPFTAQELAEWLFKNTLTAPAAGASVNTGFAAGPAILKLSQMNLSEKLLKTFEANCLCDEKAPAAWQGKEREVRQLLDACPFWREAKLAASLRGLSFDRLKNVAGAAGSAIKTAAGTLPSFRNVMSDAASFPLPEFRSAASGTTFWKDEQFDILSNSLIKLEAESSAQENKLKAAAEASKAASLGCHAFSSIAGTPLCSAALPQLFSELNLKEYSVRLLLTQQLRSARIGTADSFPFEQSEFLADTPVWQNAVHGASPSGDNAATLASWLVLEPWDGLRGKFMSANLAETARNEAEALWQQVHENAQFKLLVADPPPSTLPAAADLVPLRQKLAMLTLTGHDNWEELLKTLMAALKSLAMHSDSDAYRLMAAARLELSVTAAAAGHSPAAAVGGSNLADFNEFKKLLEVANAASQSALAWETRAGFNAVILLARFVELIGDLFFADTLQQSIGGSRIKGLIEESIKGLRQGKVLPGSDLPFALAASDLLRFARERGAGISGDLAAVPKWLQPSDIAVLTAKFTDSAVLKKMAAEGGLGFRLLLLAVMQIQLDQFERGRRLLVRPPKEKEDEGFVGLNTLHGLHEAVRMAFCAEPLIRLGLHDEQDEDAPWWQPEYWFVKGSRPTEGNPVQTVNWLESWEDNDASLSQAQVNALGWAAWLGSRVPKRLPAGFDGAAAYHAAVYSSELFCDIDGRYPGELPYLTYNAVAGTLGVEIANLQDAHREFLSALQQQKQDISTQEIKNLLKEPLRLNTSDFREQIQAALADVRRAEAELEAAEHESLAAEFEVIANQMLLDAAKLEMDREQKNIDVKKLDAQIAKNDVAIAELDEQIAAGSGEEKKNTVEKAKLVIEQTKLRKQQAQAQLDAISLEIEFIRKIVGAEDPNNPGDYGISVEINGETKIANGQIAAIALRTKDVLSKQLDTQINEAAKALAEAKKAEKEARKKAFRDGLIKAACRFIGSVVGAYCGPAGAALGAEIGGFLAELTIGVIDNKPPMDILTGLIDNTFSVASAAGFNLEKELNALGGKVSVELTGAIKELEGKLAPMLAGLPRILEPAFIQGALDVLGLEELNRIPELSEKLYNGIKNDIGDFGKIGTILKNASGFETADQLIEHFKKNLMVETRSAMNELAGVAQLVGEQVEALTGPDPAAREEAFERLMEKLASLLTGALASQSGQARQKIIKDWTGEKRRSNQFWDNPVVQDEGRKLLEHLFPENEQARKDAAVNLAEALLPPDLYRGMIQQHLAPYQQKQDELINEILEMPQPPSDAKPVDFWDHQVKQLKKAKEKFETRLFPFMEGKSLDANPHPRVELLLKVAELEREAKQELGKIETEKLQQGIDSLDLDDAKIRLKQAEDELKKAGKFVQQAELHVQKETLLMQIAQISLKKAESFEKAQEQTEKAAKARAAAAKAKIKAAKAELDAKLALFVGAQRRGVEAGRIRSGLDRPAVMLDITGYALNKARRDYANAFHNAVEAYRDMVRYCLSTFFNEDGSNGAIPISKFIRPDMLTVSGNSFASWHESLSDWRNHVETAMRSRSGRLTVQFQAFHWDLTLEQIAALTSPSGLLLEIAPQASTGYSLLDIPSHLVREGKISKEAHDYLNAKGFAVTEQSEFISVNDTDTTEPVLLWRLFDQAQYEVPVKLYDDAGKVLREVKVLSSSDPRAYEIVRHAGSDSILQIRYWPDRSRGDRQQPKVGRSLPSDRYCYSIPPAHAKNGRIVALFAELRDYPGEIPMASGDFDTRVTFMGNRWQDGNSVQLQGSANLSGFRIAEVETLATDELGLRGLFRDKMRTDVDGDIDLTNVQGTSVAGTTRIKFLLNRLPQSGKTVGSVRIAVLYKHYSS
jgi:hypothetical protein